MKIKLEADERLEITLPSGKKIRVESFGDPHDESERTLVECVTADTAMRKSDVEDAKLNNYLWSNLFRLRE